jgi:Leucine rich repeat
MSDSGYELLVRAIDHACQTQSGHLELSYYFLAHEPARTHQMESLPPEVSRLTAVRVLNLSGHRLATLPPEVGQMRDLRRLDLRGNRLNSLPDELGDLSKLEYLDLRDNLLTELPAALAKISSLERAASMRRHGGKFEDGLFVDGNPLPLPYPRLIVNGQPSATLNVLAWLRGELDSGTLQRREAFPALPEQDIGFHFEVDEAGVIGLASPSALDRYGNNVARLRAMHPTLRKLGHDLIAALSQGNRPHEQLLRRALAYHSAIDHPLEEIDYQHLYVEGALLESTGSAIRAEIAANELPRLPVEAQIAFDSLLRLHGPFMLASVAGAELLPQRATIDVLRPRWTRHVQRQSTSLSIFKTVPILFIPMPRQLC